MAQTNIPYGHPLARKMYSVAVFAETQRRGSFRRNLRGPAPKQSAAEKKLQGQSSPDFPIVKVENLSKGQGDQVSVDLFNIPEGLPVMGDRKLSGKMMNLSASSQDIRIDQYRAGIDQGGRMAQQRTKHNLRSIAKSSLGGWGGRLEDQLCQVHMAGARGFDDGRDWVVPFESHEDFDEIMVNTVEPPSASRRYLAGDATGAADLATADVLTLNELDRIATIIEEMVFPLQPIKLPEDPAKDDEPLYLFYVTPRQWNDLQQDTSAQNWRTFLANAYERSSGWNHPLFRGSPGMWRNLLVRKMPRPIRFGAGDDVREMAADGSISTVQANVSMDRALLLGAQALGEVYGSHGESGYHAYYHEEVTDHGNTVETSLAFMGGKKKFKFKGTDGKLEDHGVMAFDTHATNPA